MNSRNAEIPHGMAGGYTNYKCRCVPCKNAFKHSQIMYVFRYLDSGKPLPHGKVWCYSKLGCRCVRCSRAMAKYHRKVRQEKKMKKVRSTQS